MWCLLLVEGNIVSLFWSNKEGGFIEEWGWAYYENKGGGCIGECSWADCETKSLVGMFIASIIGLVIGNIDWGVAVDREALIDTTTFIGTLLFVVNWDDKVGCYKKGLAEVA